MAARTRRASSCEKIIPASWASDAALSARNKASERAFTSLFSLGVRTLGGVSNDICVPFTEKTCAVHSAAKPPYPTRVNVLRRSCWITGLAPRLSAAANRYVKPTRVPSSPGRTCRRQCSSPPCGLRQTACFGNRSLFGFVPLARCSAACFTPYSPKFVTHFVRPFYSSGACLRRFVSPKMSSRLTFPSTGPGKKRPAG